VSQLLSRLDGTDENSPQALPSIAHRGHSGQRRLEKEAGSPAVVWKPEGRCVSASGAWELYDRTSSEHTSLLLIGPEHWLTHGGHRSSLTDRDDSCGGQL
jgi:hypothetical protein